MRPSRAISISMSFTVFAFVQVAGSTPLAAEVMIPVGQRVLPLQIQV